MFLYNTTCNMFLKYTDTDQGMQVKEEAWTTERSLVVGLCVHRTGYSHTLVVGYSTLVTCREVDTTPDLSLGSCNVKLDRSNCPLQVMNVPTYTMT